MRWYCGLVAWSLMAWVFFAAVVLIVTWIDMNGD